MARKLTPEEATAMIIRRRLQQMQEAKPAEQKGEQGKTKETQPQQSASVRLRR